MRRIKIIKPESEEKCLNFGRRKQFSDFASKNIDWIWLQWHLILSEKWGQKRVLMESFKGHRRIIYSAILCQIHFMPHTFVLLNRDQQSSHGFDHLWPLPGSNFPNFFASQHDYYLKVSSSSKPSAYKNKLSTKWWQNFEAFFKVWQFFLK